MRQNFTRSIMNDGWTRLSGQLECAGVLFYCVGQRAREIGVRMGSGAGAAKFMRPMLGRMIPSRAHTVAGLTGLCVSDPVVYFMVLPLLLFSALLAGYLQARGATGIDPLNALRCD